MGLGAETVTSPRYEAFPLSGMIIAILSEARSPSDRTRSLVALRSIWMLDGFSIRLCGVFGTAAAVTRAVALELGIWMLDSLSIRCWLVWVSGSAEHSNFTGAWSPPGRIRSFGPAGHFELRLWSLYWAFRTHCYVDLFSLLSLRVYEIRNEYENTRRLRWMCGGCSRCCGNCGPGAWLAFPLGKSGRCRAQSAGREWGNSQHSPWTTVPVTQVFDSAWLRPHLFNSFSCRDGEVEIHAYRTVRPPRLLNSCSRGL